MDNNVLCLLEANLNECEHKISHLESLLKFEREQTYLKETELLNQRKETESLRNELAEANKKLKKQIESEKATEIIKNYIEEELKVNNVLLERLTKTTNIYKEMLNESESKYKDLMGKVKEISALKEEAEMNVYVLNESKDFYQSQVKLNL